MLGEKVDFGCMGFEVPMSTVLDSLRELGYVIVPPGTPVQAEHDALIAERDEACLREIAALGQAQDAHAKYEDALRQGVRNANRAHDLEDAICEYLLWEPGRRGHAAALKALRAVLDTNQPEEGTTT